MWRLRLYTLFELGLPLLALPAILITLPNIHDTSTRARSFDPVPVYGGFGDIFQSIAGNDQIAKRACGKVPENRNLTVLYYSTLKDAEVLMNKFSARYVNPYTSASFFPLQKVDSIEEMKEILKNDSVKICSRYFGGIEITTLNSTHPVAFHYRIQMSSFFGQWNLNDNWDQIVFTRPTDLSPIPPQPLYWSSGILSVQRALDKAFLTMTNRSIDYELKLQRAPTPAYHNAAHIAVLSSFYRFGFLLIVVVIQTASEVLTEKESGMKAYLAVMGLRPFIFSFSHWLMGFLKAVLPLVVSIAPVLSHMEVIKAVLIAAYVIIYAASIASFSLLMSSILRSSSAVNKIVLLIWSLTVVMCDWDIPVSDAVLALNPTKAFYFAIDAFVTSERIGMFIG
ncbi:hypothetical protein QR680_007000 [Steinernema hermaphroditum]|uniref:ABC-2 type transporter transmembrane domain-containing protein n=1 Tax=Steinernema hermaphroditum TaxID=289476 RepID=A0AA39HZS2_9BILA|nr:hypothetical protein QR680_007000 [Steinernema hermaphroditum]